MSTVGAFNKKNPTIKRILKEASELASSASPDYHAEPLESNLFEWHFTLRGPPAPSPYAGGVYHGRIVLPPAYPLRPPSFRFLTPTGRFEVNREVCLSISGHHEETWQPAWGIRTALVALRAFMDSDAGGQVGGVNCDDATRRAFARESPASRCAACGGRSNGEIMREREEAAAAAAEAAGSEGTAAAEEMVPPELRLAYREDLGQPAQPAAAETAHSGARGHATAATTPASPETGASTRQAQAPAQPAAPRPAPAAPVATQQQLPRHDVTMAWLDKAIYGVIGALIFMVLRQLA